MSTDRKGVTMTTDHRRLDALMAQGILLDDPNFLLKIVERVLQELLEAEMTEHIGAAPHERTNARKGHRNGYKRRTLRTRVGTLNLLVPQDREGTFSTRLFSRYQRNEKALCLALMGISMKMSSRRRSLVCSPISQHRPQDVDPPSGEGDHGLGVPLALSPFAII